MTFPWSLKYLLNNQFIKGKSKDIFFKTKYLFNFYEQYFIGIVALDSLICEHAWSTGRCYKLNNNYNK